MPTISEFFGIVIRMYYADHAPPHFHAYYNEDEAIICIQTGKTIEGNLSNRALNLVQEWHRLNQDALLENWENAINHNQLNKIKPLR